jgi:hypothetical protein
MKEAKAKSHETIPLSDNLPKVMAIHTLLVARPFPEGGS